MLNHSLQKIIEQLKKDMADDPELVSLLSSRDESDLYFYWELLEPPVLTIIEWYKIRKDKITRGKNR